MYVPNGENVINPMMDVQIRVETIGLQQDNENNIRAMDVSFMDESDMTNKQKRENVRRTDSNPRRTKTAGGRKQNLCKIVIILAPLIMALKVKESAQDSTG